MLTQSLVATVVSWIGIVGGVLTIFGHLQSAFSLSDWGRWIAAHWQSWMMTFWGDYLGLSHLTSDNGFILVDFPFIFCLVLIAIASRIAKSTDPEVPLSRKFYSLLAGAGLLAAWYALLVYLAQRGISVEWRATAFGKPPRRNLWPKSSL